MTALTYFHGLLPMLPEFILALGAMVLLLIGAAAGEGSARLVNVLAILVMIGAAWAIVALAPGRHALFGGSFVVDDFARFLKLLALAGSAGALILSLDYLKLEQQQKFEYGALFLLSTLGMLMLISAADLIALYLGLELMSLSLYVVAAYERENVRSTEAGLKYFVLGALSSGMLLYGASLVYGFTGTVNFAGIAKATGEDAGIGLIFGLVFLFVGFCFKISAVPFHMWTPDVYEGAPTPVTAFFAAAPKVAAIAIFMRASVSAFPGITHEWQQIVVFVSIASMALGSFAAIGQRNIKRLMAYSSIGHMG
ncbi:MAG: NADH-quinone oxidoreductase subunit N, partial [Pseudolabrys sp.]